MDSDAGTGNVHRWEEIKMPKKAIEFLPKDVAQQQYAKALEEELGYTGRVKYDEIDRLRLASCLNLHDFIHQDGRISSIPVMLGIIQEYNRFLTSQSIWGEEVQDLVKNYHQQRQGLVKQLEEAVRSTLLPELPLTSRDELYRLYLRIVGSEDSKNQRKKGLGEHLADIIESTLDGRSGLSGTLHSLFRRYEEKEILERDYTIVQKNIYPAGQSLIKSMGLSELAQLKILDEKEEKVNLDRIPKLVEVAGWLFFKYPSQYVLLWDGLKIAVPERLVREEKLAKPGEEKKGWTVYYDHPMSDYGNC